MAKKNAKPVWAATHVITWTPVKGNPETWLVMHVPSDNGMEGSRYTESLYTKSEWEATADSDWTMDADGRVWFQGKESPGPGITDLKVA